MQTLVLTDYWWGQWGGAKAIFKIIGGPTWPLQPNPLDFTPMLHVPIRFDTSP